MIAARFIETNRRFYEGFDARKLRLRPWRVGLRAISTGLRHAIDGDRGGTAFSRPGPSSRTALRTVFEIS